MRSYGSCSASTTSSRTGRCSTRQRQTRCGGAGGRAALLGHVHACTAALGAEPAKGSFMRFGDDTGFLLPPAREACRPLE